MQVYRIACPVCGKLMGLRKDLVNKLPVATRFTVSCSCGATLSYNCDDIIRENSPTRLQQNNRESYMKSFEPEKSMTSMEAADMRSEITFTSLTKDFRKLAADENYIAQCQNDFAVKLQQILPEFERDLKRNRVAKSDAVSMLKMLNKVFPEAKVILDMLQHAKNPKELFDTIDLMSKITTYIDE